MTEQQPNTPRRRKPRAPGREEIEALWASVMRDDTAGIKDRMHAAELCARAIDTREQQARDDAARQESAAVGRLDEVLHALWGCKAGGWDG